MVPGRGSRERVQAHSKEPVQAHNKVRVPVRSKPVPVHRNPIRACRAVWTAIHRRRNRDLGGVR